MASRKVFNVDHAGDEAHRGSYFVPEGHGDFPGLSGEIPPKIGENPIYPAVGNSVTMRMHPTDFHARRILIQFR